MSKHSIGILAARAYYLNLTLDPYELFKVYGMDGLQALPNPRGRVHRCNVLFTLSQTVGPLVGFPWRRVSPLSGVIY